MEKAWPSSSSMNDAWSLPKNTGFYNYKQELETHLPVEMSTAFTTKFENLEKLFTEGSSLSYNGEIWNVQCDWLTDSSQKISGVFLRMHSSNQLGGYQYSNREMINTTIIKPDFRLLSPGHLPLIESSLLNVLRDGHLSEEEIPVVPQYFAEFVSGFFQTALQLLPPTDPMRLPLPQFVKTPTPVDKPITPNETLVPPKLNSGRILSTLAILGGAIYLISKYARTHFASLKEISLDKNSLFATPQSRMLLLVYSLVLLSTLLFFSRRRRRTQY